MRLTILGPATSAIEPARSKNVPVVRKPMEDGHNSSPSNRFKSLAIAGRPTAMSPLLKLVIKLSPPSCAITIHAMRVERGSRGELELFCDVTSLLSSCWTVTMDVSSKLEVQFGVVHTGFEGSDSPDPGLPGFSIVSNVLVSIYRRTNNGVKVRQIFQPTNP
jgi:hypothetical protein